MTPVVGTIKPTIEKSGRMEHSPPKRWRSPQRQDAACSRHTKSDAIAFFKELLGVKKLPDGFEIEAF